MVGAGDEPPPPSSADRAAIGCAGKPAALSLAAGVGCCAALPALSPAGEPEVA